MPNDEHLIPPRVKDLVEKISNPHTASNERFYAISILEATKKYIENKLFMVNKKK